MIDILINLFFGSGAYMNSAKEKLLTLLEEMTDKEIIKILEFTERLLLKKGTYYAKEAPKSQEALWDNDLDDYI